MLLFNRCTLLCALFVTLAVTSRAEDKPQPLTSNPKSNNNGALSVSASSTSSAQASSGNEHSPFQSLSPSSTNRSQFRCPEKFGYFADANDCTKYFVCVFGEPLHESCTGGLYFSAELQTCDWPRNVLCRNADGSLTLIGGSASGSSGSSAPGSLSSISSTSDQQNGPEANGGSVFSTVDDDEHDGDGSDNGDYNPPLNSPTPSSNSNDNEFKATLSPIDLVGVALKNISSDIVNNRNHLDVEPGNGVPGDELLSRSVDGDLVRNHNQIQKESANKASSVATDRPDMITDSPDANKPTDSSILYDSDERRNSDANRNGGATIAKNKQQVSNKINLDFEPQPPNYAEAVPSVVDSKGGIHYSDGVGGTYGIVDELPGVLSNGDHRHSSTNRNQQHHSNNNNNNNNAGPNNSGNGSQGSSANGYNVFVKPLPGTQPAFSDYTSDQLDKDLALLERRSRKLFGNNGNNNSNNNNARSNTNNNPSNGNAYHSNGNEHNRDDSHGYHYVPVITPEKLLFQTTRNPFELSTIAENANQGNLNRVRNKPPNSLRPQARPRGRVIYADTEEEELKVHEPEHREQPNTLPPPPPPSLLPAVVNKPKPTGGRSRSNVRKPAGSPSSNLPMRPRLEPGVLPPGSNGFIGVIFDDEEFNTQPVTPSYDSFIPTNNQSPATARQPSSHSHSHVHQHQPAHSNAGPQVSRVVVDHQRPRQSNSNNLPSNSQQEPHLHSHHASRSSTSNTLHPTTPLPPASRAAPHNNNNNKPSIEDLARDGLWHPVEDTRKYQDPPSTQSQPNNSFRPHRPSVATSYDNNSNRHNHHQNNNSNNPNSLAQPPRNSFEIEYNVDFPESERPRAQPSPHQVARPQSATRSRNQGNQRNNNHRHHESPLPTLPALSSHTTPTPITTVYTIATTSTTTTIQPPSSPVRWQATTISPPTQTPSNVSSGRGRSNNNNNNNNKPNPISTQLAPRRKSNKRLVIKPKNLLTDPPQLASRPPALYETPIPGSQAKKCDRNVCKLPDCNCGGPQIPGNLREKETPQLVLLTFDDAVNDLNWELYEEIFNTGRKNPNGCPLVGSFYVSHEWTDYGQVQTLYSRGHEIASHGVTHSFGEKFSKNQWLKEINGQREILHLYGGVPLPEIRGMRAPFLQIGGNRMFEMLHEANFTYDSSMPVFDNRPPFWPYTLDYAINHECMITPCPTKSYPGLWEVGMVMWEDLRGGRCSMGDACSNPSTEEEVHEMLLKNFNRHYKSNRAPFGLYYHSAWFNTAHHRRGFMKFLDEILSNDDVYLTTNWQMLQWIRQPVPVSQLTSHPAFQCDRSALDSSGKYRQPVCSHANVCNVRHKSGGSRFMKTCQPCPNDYPWVGNTGFPKQLYG